MGEKVVSQFGAQDERICRLGGTPSRGFTMNGRVSLPPRQEIIPPVTRWNRGRSIGWRSSASPLTFSLRKHVQRLEIELQMAK